MELYSYVFHYNAYTELWNAIPTDAWLKYWNDEEDERILRARDLNVLIELVNRGQEFVNTINQEDVS
jgi:hypothetical protein